MFDVITVETLGNSEKGAALGTYLVARASYSKKSNETIIPAGSQFIV